ncbi:methyltransferase-like protein 13-like [Dorcoceras hygrometricum]|uniref:Methyltransferase-like protein 13-like n=1 Tax=Dorcoceras hygrometricum TaxID=472368 RepID=A0A2Z7CNV4_9LAMI|nr:methyltransferase-like protein 13-like [Dorcoceras hygrometricum]
MGKKEKKKKTPKSNTTSSVEKQEELLKTLDDFTSKENWDQFFTVRGCEDSFEWYAEWPQVQNLLTTHLLSSSSPPESEGALPHVEAEQMSILVPGCGNSKLSEHLYDAGFRNITNVDFSKVVISNMLRRNVRERPGMKWRVMDMTDMQFVNESFDAIIDKGGLDALMEPEHGSKLGNLYLSEVRRLLKAGGKFICFTLAESHVLDLLLPKYRFGWKIRLHAISEEPSSRNLKLQTIMLIAEKDNVSAISVISAFTDQSSIICPGYQASGISEALEREKKFRSEYSSGSDILYSLEDLNLGARGDLAELAPGRRVKLTLGEPGVSYFSYRAVLLDAKPDSGPFSYNFGVFLVPKTRAHEWLFSSEEGQWLVVVSSKAARLLMIILDSSQASASMEDIQMDLSPLVKQLSPGNIDGVQIPISQMDVSRFMAANDGIKHRKIVHQVTSTLTGQIVVEDVICEKLDAEIQRRFPSKDLIFRRLTFQRAESLVQSEAIVSVIPDDTSNKVEDKIAGEASKSRKKGKQQKFDPQLSGSLVSLDRLQKASSSKILVDQNYLASSYHNGIISGLMLISLHLERLASVGNMVKTVVIGLGAGLLPMFLRKNIPFLEIEVVELDPVVLDVARHYFGFIEDQHLKVHIADGIKFVGDMEKETCTNDKNDTFDQKLVGEEGKGFCRIDILIVDVDSDDSSSGLTCPAADFVEESFLLTAKSSLSEQGLFIVNLVSRSSAVKVPVYSRLKMVFSNLYTLQLEEDVNEVIFALKSDTPVEDDKLSDVFLVLARLLELEKQEWSQSIVDASKLIKRLI